jgi:hypothetical protein
MQIIAIPTEVARNIRTGLAPAVAWVAEGGEPCRHCLEDAAPGETMLLFSYCPFQTDGPYREVGPIYVHARPCARFEGDAIPDQLRRRLLALRGYDVNGDMLDAEIVDGRQMAPLAERLLSRDDVAFVHVRNARPGCFACEIRR